jgi:hypothetical protein
LYTDTTPLFILGKTVELEITPWEELKHLEGIHMNEERTELKARGVEPKKLNEFPETFPDEYTPVIGFFDLSFEGLTALMVFLESQKTHVSLIISNNGKNLTLKRDLEYPSHAGIVIKRDKSEMKYYLESGASLTLWYDETENRWEMYR